jgi:hypothetical protein
MPRGFAKVAEDIAEVRQELKSDLEAVRSELKEEIAAVRTKLKGEIADLRTDMRDGFASIHEELRDIRQRLETLEEAARNAAGLTNRYGKLHRPSHSQRQSQRPPRRQELVRRPLVAPSPPRHLPEAVTRRAVAHHADHRPQVFRTYEKGRPVTRTTLCLSAIS